VGAWQRRSAKGLGASGKLHGGGVGFRQYFGSALQLTPHLHLHVLVPEGLWTDGAGWVGVPPPDTEDVERILRRVMKGLAKDFAEVGEGWAEDGLEALWLEGGQHRLPLGEEPKRERRRGRRAAMLEGSASMRTPGCTATTDKGRSGCAGMGAGALWRWSG
jgi:hypothetical protein